MIDKSLNVEVWSRLIQGKTLDELALPTKDGRVDLSRLTLPEPSVIRRYHTPVAAINEIEPGAILRGAKWRNLDFTGSKLNGLRLFSCELDNCLFDDCQLRDLRLWSTKISSTSFRGADLRKSALGGVEDGRRNVFSGVNFTDADLRQTAYTAAAFSKCIFRDTKLDKVDFQTSTFSECQFEGEITQVLFYRSGFKGETFPPNEMIDVDFSRARLRYVEFRGLTLDRVRLPDDAEHIVIKNYPAALDKLVATLQRQSDLPSKQLAAYLGVFRKWAAPHQVQGVLNTQDLTEIAGPESPDRVRELLQK